MELPLAPRLLGSPVNNNNNNNNNTSTYGTFLLFKVHRTPYSVDCREREVKGTYLRTVKNTPGTAYHSSPHSNNNTIIFYLHTLSISRLTPKSKVSARTKSNQKHPPPSSANLIPIYPQYCPGLLLHKSVTLPPSLGTSTDIQIKAHDHPTTHRILSVLTKGPKPSQSP